MNKTTKSSKQCAHLNKCTAFVVVLLILSLSALFSVQAAETSGVIELQSINNVTEGINTIYNNGTIEIGVNGNDTEIEIVVETSSDIIALNVELINSSWGRMVLTPMEYIDDEGVYKQTISLPANVRSGYYYLSFYGNPEGQPVYKDYADPVPLIVHNNQEIINTPIVLFSYDIPSTTSLDVLNFYFYAQSPYGIASVDYWAYFPEMQMAIGPNAEYNTETGLWEDSIVCSDYDISIGDTIIIMAATTDKLGNTTSRPDAVQYILQVGTVIVP